MKVKVQAQRKFAQGAYVPPNANVTNAVVNRRVDPTDEKAKRFVLRHNTSAKILLDSISFESVHKHNPVVLLERIQDQPIVQVDNKEPTVSEELQTPAVNNVTTDVQEHPVPNQVSSLGNATQNNSPTTEKILNKVITKRKRSKINFLKCVNLQKKNEKSCMKLRSAIPTPIDTNFSIDDNKPLIFYRKKTFKHKDHILRQNNKIVKAKLAPLKTQLALAAHIYSESNRDVLQLTTFVRTCAVAREIDNIVQKQSSNATNRTKTGIDKNSAQGNGKMHDAASEEETEITLETSHTSKTCSFCKTLIKNLKTYQKTLHEDGCLTLNLGITIFQVIESITVLLNALKTGKLGSQIIQSKLPTQYANKRKQLKERRQSVACKEKQVKERVQSVACKEKHVKERVQSVACKEKPVMERRKSVLCPEKQVNERRQSVVYQEEQVSNGRPSVSGKEKKEKEKTQSVSEQDKKSKKRRQSIYEQYKQVKEKRKSGAAKEKETRKRTSLDSDHEMCLIERTQSVSEQGKQVRERRKLVAAKEKETREKTSLDSDYEMCLIERRQSASEQGKQVRERTKSVAAKEKETRDRTSLDSDYEMCSIERRQSVSEQGKQVRKSRKSVASKGRKTREKSNLDSDSDHDRPLIERRQSVSEQRKPVRERRFSVACYKRPVRDKRLSVTCEERPVRERRRSVSIQENPVKERRRSVTFQNMPLLERRYSFLVDDTSFVHDEELTAAENHSETKATKAKTRRTAKPSNQENENEYETCNKSKGKIVEAPEFRPTEAEFRDPVAYFQKITPEAAKYGLCKVIAPPGFKPTCTMNDTIRFVVTNQYLARFYSRWGPVTRELCALRSFLSSQNIVFSHSPLMEGLEVNLPKILHFVQRQGGLKAKVESRTYVDTRKWNKLADELNYNKLHNPGKKLDQIYVKYLLPYDALTQRERQELTEKMDSKWSKRNDKLIRRAQNPLHRQKRLLGESDSSDDDDFEDDQPMTAALNEAEECVVRGRVVNHANFKKIAATALNIFFPSTPSTFEIEAQYWKLVLLGNEHVCVNTASIDTGAEGLGFSKNKNDPFSKHPWNLKMLSQNPGNVLRSLGSVLGVTVPTLHVGMIYSTSCWHRDPHGLPWIEYMHTGPEKIWYGIADSESTKFRRAVENLCPSACQNKSIWLPSDIAMIPPTLLLERNVSMSRVVQKPGEYVIVFPKAYSCSISTGYTVSESVYFATSSWVKSVNYVFQELRKSCEPTMFSLEQLLIAVARDPNASLTMLQLVHESFSAILSEELDNRRLLEKHGLKPLLVDPESRSEAGDWNVHENECEVCRSSLYLSRVKGVFRKRYSVCLRHALHVLDSNNKKIIRCKKETYELEYFFSSTELEEVISSTPDVEDPNGVGDCEAFIMS